MVTANRQIDALVYELYGLTEEEIGVVEGLDHEWRKRERKGFVLFVVFCLSRDPKHRIAETLKMLIALKGPQRSQRFQRGQRFRGRN